MWVKMSIFRKTAVPSVLGYRQTAKPMPQPVPAAER